MAYEQRDMSGSIFKNNRRERDTQANLTGSAMIDGREYWVNAWTKTKTDGEKWISLSFNPKKPKEETHQYTVGSPEPLSAGLSDDTDIPF